VHFPFHMPTTSAVALSISHAPAVSKNALFLRGAPPPTPNRRLFQAGFSHPIPAYNTKKPWGPPTSPSAARPQHKSKPLSGGANSGARGQSSIDWPDQAGLSARRWIGGQGGRGHPFPGLTLPPTPATRYSEHPPLPVPVGEDARGSR